MQCWKSFESHDRLSPTIVTEEYFRKGEVLCQDVYLEFLEGVSSVSETSCSKT